LLLASGVALAAVITGTDGADSMEGTPRSDTIQGFRGEDTITGRASGDTLRGYSGNDTTDGQGGGDTIIAGTGASNKIFARDREQDLICVNPDYAGRLVTANDKDEFIDNNSC